MDDLLSFSADRDRHFDVIKMSFLPVGHTHEDTDQAFSRIAVHLNRNDALTMDEFIKAIRGFVKW